MQVRKNNYLVNATPTFQVLGEDEIEAIYFSALRVLSETGVRVYEKEGVEVAYSAAPSSRTRPKTAAWSKCRPGWWTGRAPRCRARWWWWGPAISQHRWNVQEPDLLRRRLRHALYARSVHGRAAARDVQRCQKSGPLGEALPNYDFHMSLGIVQDTGGGHL